MPGLLLHTSTWYCTVVAVYDEYSSTLVTIVLGSICNSVLLSALYAKCTGTHGTPARCWATIRAHFMVIRITMSFNNYYNDITIYNVNTMSIIIMIYLLQCHGHSNSAVDLNRILGLEAAPAGFLN